MYINVNAKTLAAVAFARSFEETRYYLNGVCFEDQDLIATDGHVLTVAHDETAQNDAPRGTILPVSKKALTALKKAKAERAVMDGKTLTIYDDLDGILYIEPCAPIDGNFPDWRRVVPQKHGERTLAHFSSIVLSQLVETSKVFGKAVPIRLTGEDAASPHVVRYGDKLDVFSVAMPMRGADLTDFPAWFKEDKRAA